jgi:AcrR family transcriptional regulator
MDDIALRAGVAVGTLYHHFPAKADLIDAVIDDGIAHIADLAESMLAAVQDGAEITKQVAALFAATVERHATDHAFKAAVGVLELPSVDYLESSPLATSRGRAVRAITALLDKARAAGTVRSDLTFADFVMLIGAAPTAQPAPMRQRYVDIVLAGLMTAAAYAAYSRSGCPVGSP